MVNFTFEEGYNQGKFPRENGVCFNESAFSRETRKNKGISDRGKSVYKVTRDNTVHGRNYNQAELKRGAHGEVLLTSQGCGSGSVANVCLWGTERY